jgi:branched-chain amino acid transport system permease protein
MSFPFFQLLLNSLIIGSIYALVACGFSLIYATNRFVHFAHGSSVAAAAYFAYALTIAHVPFAVSVVLTLLFAGLFGAFLYYAVYLPLQKRSSSGVILLIASVALLILVENLILLLFGADVKSFRQFSTPTIIKFLGASLTLLQLVIIGVACALFILLYIFMKCTRLGKMMRAVADNKDLADIMGIHSKRIALYSFFIGSLLAGIAGILIGLEQNLEPTMGTHLMVKGFTGAIIGGVTSVSAAVLGSFILGIAENFGVWFLPSGYKDAIAFGLLFLFLIFKPTGLFGLNKGVRK